MQRIGRIAVSCGLVLASCNDDGGAATSAWMPETGDMLDTTSDGAGESSQSDGAVSEDGSTDEGGNDSSSDDGSTGTSTGSLPPDTDTEAEPEPLPIPEGMQLPFVCGQAWRLDSWGHAPALDMVREPDQVGTEGATLVAPAPGVVNQSFFHDNAGNVVQIDHGAGYFTTYLHMQSRSVEAGAVVALGDEIGAVGKTGPTSNGHPHLHFELGFDGDGDGEASWGFEGAERVPPWFDGVEYGQRNGLTWRDVVSANCP